MKFYGEKKKKKRSKSIESNFRGKRKKYKTDSLVRTFSFHLLKYVTSKESSRSLVIVN